MKLLKERMVQSRLNWPIVKEGFLFILFFALLSVVVSFYWGLVFALLPIVITFFMIFFFRNPKREIPQEKGVIVAPADGHVTAVEYLEYDDFLESAGIKVVIFLSVFDVHVNRSPIAGEIKLKRYTCGRFIPAYNKLAGWENERLMIGLENEKIRVVVTQIAGILARRIVSWVSLGAKLLCGERYGMIKFGSCTELIMPDNVELLVKKGDRVLGGETVVGRQKE